MNIHRKRMQPRTRENSTDRDRGAAIIIGSIGAITVAAILMGQSQEDQTAPARKPATVCEIDLDTKKRVVQPGEGINHIVYEVPGITNENGPGDECFDTLQDMFGEQIAKQNEYGSQEPQAGDTIQVPKSVFERPAR